MDYSDFKLGVDSHLIQLKSWEENRLVATLMAKQCRRHLDIISRLLDPFIFNSPEFVDAVRQLVLSKRRPKIRIIVFDPQRIISNDHQLVSLAGDLSSFIEIRKASNEYKYYNECLMLADRIAYLNRIDSERYEATANFNDRKKCKYFDDEFIEMWESALPDPNMRRVNL